MKLKENKGIGLAGFIITILVILLVIAVAGCVYLYKNPVKEEVAVQNPVPTAQVNSSSGVKPTETKTTAMTADEKFAQYAQNLKAVMKKYNEEKVEGKEYREYQIDGKDANDNNYSIKLSGNGTLKLNEKDVATNVIGFNVAYIGNGGYKNLYFIKDNGTVAYASIDETQYLGNGNVKTVDVKELKNIVSIMSGVSGTYGYPGACYAYAVDIEGNMFEI